MPPVLRGELVRLRPPDERDIADLVRIRRAPEVYAHWRGGDDLVAAVHEEFAEPDSTGYDGLLMDLLAEELPAGEFPAGNDN